jgi:hypothetical protein
VAITVLLEEFALLLNEARDSVNLP